MSRTDYTEADFERDWLQFQEEEAEREREARSHSRSGTTDGHLMFVYGSLKSGFGNHGLLKRGNGVFIGEAVTRDPAFDMLSMTAFPAVFQGGNFKIAGEVYAVDNSCLRTLDQLEGNGHFYTRKEVMVRVYNRFGIGQKDFEVPAWIYMVPAPDENSFFERLYRPEGQISVLNWKR